MPDLAASIVFHSPLSAANTPLLLAFVLSRHAHSPCHTPVAEGCLNPAFPVFVPTFIPLFARISQALDAQPANQGRIN